MNIFASALYISESSARISNFDRVRMLLPFRSKRKFSPWGFIYRLQKVSNITELRPINFRNMARTKIPANGRVVIVDGSRVPKPNDTPIYARPRIVPPPSESVRIPPHDPGRVHRPRNYRPDSIPKPNSGAVHPYQVPQSVPKLAPQSPPPADESSIVKPTYILEWKQPEEREFTVQSTFDSLDDVETMCDDIRCIPERTDLTGLVGCSARMKGIVAGHPIIFRVRRIN